MAIFSINPAKHRHPGYIVAIEFIEDQLSQIDIKGIRFGEGWDDVLDELNTTPLQDAVFTIDLVGYRKYKFAAVEGAGLSGEVSVFWDTKPFPKETVVEYLRMDGTNKLCLEELLWHYNAVAGKGHKLTTAVVKDFDYVDDKAVITLSKHHPSAAEDTQIVLKLVNLRDK